MIARALVIIMAVGISLRLANTTPYNIYPDAYQSVLVSQNIQQNRSVVGFLGENGLRYPPFIEWTRPGYPLMIKAAHLFIGDQETAAHGVSLFMGIMAIPIAHMLSKNVWAALLMSLSFSHIVWGGFILTETTAVLLIMLFLVILIPKQHEPSKFADIRDLTAGAVFGMAVFTRYEYIVLLLPFIWFVSTGPTPVTRLINVALSFLFITSLIFTSLYDFNSVMQAVQNRQAALAGMQIIPLRGLLEFIKHDFLLVVAYAAGLAASFKSKPDQRMTYLSIMAAIVLIPLYAVANANASRYLTHLIPFLLYPASIGLKSLSRNKVFQVIISFLVIVQFWQSFSGIRFWQGGAWFRKSYSQKSAEAAAAVIHDPKAILIASLPEPYYYFTKLSTLSVSSSYPFVQFPTVYDSMSVYIAIDMGMTDLFPSFSTMVQQNFSDRLIAEYWVHESYHFADRTIEENMPVKIYATTIEEYISRTRILFPGIM